MYARWHLSRKVFPHCDPRPVRDAERSFRLCIPCLGTLGKVRFAINRTIISSSVSSSRWEDEVAREGRAFFLSPRNIERYRVEAHARNRERERRERSVWKGAGETVARRSRWTERCPACATGDEADLEERGNRRDPRAAALYRPRRPTTATKRARSD